MFSKSCQYAIQAILYIGLKGGNKTPVSIKSICNDQNIPNHFLAKILQLLVKQKILSSVKGPNGGFILNKPIRNFKLIEVVEFIDGSEIFNQCGIGFKRCSDDTPCPVHDTFRQVKNKIKEILTQKSLKQLCDEINEGKTNLILYSKS
ncbi:MAG: Rrf2 family transcriptional regulator [Cyclobacteriaceae bacterium]|nr:Rrf2 family transcriptional regulator [Cyclobacteriaceae bacterium]